MKVLRPFLLPAMVLVLQPHVTFSQTPATAALVEGPKAERIHGMLTSLLDSGYSGAVIDETNGRPILKAGYGYANRERQVPFTTSTIAQIGSITKHFTAAAIVDLSQRGKLTFADTLARFFPQAPAATRGTTIHQLLTHTSGLSEYCGPDFSRISRVAFMERCLAWRSDSAGPAYSNVGTRRSRVSSRRRAA